MLLYSALNVIDSREQLYEKLMIVLVEQLQSRFESNYSRLKDYGWKCNSNGDIEF